MRYFIVLLVMGWCPLEASANAWVLEQGQKQAIHKFEYYRATSYFDHQGKRRSQQPYETFLVNPYVEYGYKPTITLGMSSTVQSIRKTDSEADQSTEYEFNAYDLELLVRKQVWKEGHRVFSLQPMVRLFNDVGNPTAQAIDDYAVATELRALYGQNLAGRPFAGYIDLALAYRYDFFHDGAELRADLKVGWEVSEKWLVMPQLLAVINGRTTYVNLFLGNTPLTYDAIKFQTSVVYHYNRKFSLQFGLNKEMWGRNSGEGYGVFLALWHHF